jgi:hypothetical protein
MSALTITSSLSVLTEAKTSVNRLAELLSALEISAPRATSWRWMYEEQDDFSNVTRNCQELITDVRDWFDLTCTARSEFDGLVARLEKSRPGERIRLSIKRDGRKVEIKDVSEETRAELSIECL